MRLLVCLAAFGLFCLPLFGEQTQLKAGEAFQYSLYCVQGFIPIPAGTASLSVAATNLQGGAAFALDMALDASSVVEKVYHFRTRFRSLVTPELEPILYEKSAEEGSRFYVETTTFTRLESGEHSVDCRREFKEGRVETGRETRKGRIYDLVSVCFFARSLRRSMAKGERMPVSVVSGVKVRDRTLVYSGEDAASGENGEKVSCDVFALMGDVKGDGPEKEIARFWISQDSCRIPVRIDMALKWGSISVRLEKREFPIRHCPEADSRFP